jgi:hypothetical protein
MNADLQLQVKIFEELYVPKEFLSDLQSRTHKFNVLLHMNADLQLQVKIFEELYVPKEFLSDLQSLTHKFNTEFQI